MKFNLETFLFLLISIFLAYQSIFASDQETRISNADEEWTTNVGQINQEVIDSSEAPVKLPNEALVCHADEVWSYGLEVPSRDVIDSSEGSVQLPKEAVVSHADEVWSYGLEAPSQDVIDSSEAAVKLPKEAVVCHADEVWSSDLVVRDDIGSGPTDKAKTPVLFVPGILGTEIKNGEETVWFNDDLVKIWNSDEILDILEFDKILSPLGKNLILSDVIKKKNFFKIWNYDYTQGLINEFAGRGYVEGRDFFTFPYDWRYGVSGVYPDRKTNSVLLKEKIDDLAKDSPTGKVDVIAHSLGGLVVKKYVMDNIDPKINKLVFLGVPNLGAPEAVKTLLMGSDFKVPGLNSQEVYKITRNMPAAYDLLPSQKYFSTNGGYVYNLNTFPFGSKMDYGAINKLFRDTGLNKDGLSNSAALHTPEFENYDVRAKNIDAYNVVGCKAPTFAGVDYLITDTGLDGFSSSRDRISGDDTVPRESAESIVVDPEKTFYSIRTEHGKMPSYDGIRQKIANIITGGNLNEGATIYKKSQVDMTPRLCKMPLIILIVLSPVDIVATDQDGNVTGIDGEGNTRYEIPGSGFEESNGHKYLYLPADTGQDFNIGLKGTGNGTFTLIEKNTDGDQTISAIAFNDIPVTPEFSAILDVDGASAQIKTEGGLVINPTSQIDGTASEDIIPPFATSTICGLMGKEGFYRGDVMIALSARDFAQEGVTASGVFSLSYSLDGSATTTVQGASTTIDVVGEGSHSLTFQSFDKMGNKEDPKTINFTIDRTVNGEPSALTVVNKVIPATDTGKFNLLIDGEVRAANVGNRGTTGAITVDSGIHTVSLTAGTNTNLANYATAISGDCGADGKININEGDNKVCTITNTRVNTGTLIINKKSGTANGVFSFALSGPTPLSPMITTASGTGTTGSLILKAGQYTLKEIVPAGWSLTGLSCSVSCSGSCSSSMSQINFVQKFKMQKNMKITCTFTNKKK